MIEIQISSAQFKNIVGLLRDIHAELALIRGFMQETDDQAQFLAKKFLESYGFKLWVEEKKEAE